jgi:hypothetical protein
VLLIIPSTAVPENFAAQIVQICFLSFHRVIQKETLTSPKSFFPPQNVNQWSLRLLLRPHCSILALRVQALSDEVCASHASLPLCK